MRPWLPMSCYGISTIIIIIPPSKLVSNFIIIILLVFIIIAGGIIIIIHKAFRNKSHTSHGQRLGLKRKEMCELS